MHRFRPETKVTRLGPGAGRGCRPRMPWGRLLAITVAATIPATIPCSLAAQYFGGNKVQYESFDFDVLSTPHFDIYFYPAEHEAVV
jgi:hypothetical protein